MTIINKKTHAVQWSSAFMENWMGEDWVVVPPELEEAAQSCGGCCELTFDRAGNLTGLTPTEKPVPPVPKPSEAERLRADMDFLAAMTGVSL